MQLPSHSPARPGSVHRPPVPVGQFTPSLPPPSPQPVTLAQRQQQQYAVTASDADLLAVDALLMLSPDRSRVARDGRVPAAQQPAAPLVDYQLSQDVSVYDDCGDATDTEDTLLQPQQSSTSGDAPVQHRYVLCKDECERDYD